MCNSQVMKKIISFLLRLSYIWKPSIQNSLPPEMSLTCFSWTWPKTNFLSLGLQIMRLPRGLDLIRDLKHKHFSLRFTITIRSLSLNLNLGFLQSRAMFCFKVSDNHLATQSFPLSRCKMVMHLTHRTIAYSFMMKCATQAGPGLHRRCADKYVLLLHFFFFYSKWMAFKSMIE